MAVFFLFRLKAIRGNQSPLFSTGTSRRDFVEKLLHQKPSHEIRSGYIWHIGNLREVGEDGVLFAVGRTTIASKEKWDEDTGDFLEVYDEESPFTYVIYDKKLSVLAITPKSKLAPTTKGIARNFAKLLNSHPYTRDNEIRIEIIEIPDPENFIKQIHDAYAVVGFQMEFGEPNPFDVEKDFHKPMESLLEATRGDKGATKVEGDDLDRVTLEILSRSVASVGNEASARIRKAAGDRPITKHLKGGPASFLVKTLDQAEEIFLKLRDTYRSIRRSVDDD